MRDLAEVISWVPVDLHLLLPFGPRDVGAELPLLEYEELVTHLALVYEHLPALEELGGEHLAEPGELEVVEGLEEVDLLEPALVHLVLLVLGVHHQHLEIL